MMYPRIRKLRGAQEANRKSAASPSPSAHWALMMATVTMVASVMSSSSALTLCMNYKPPVKSSVSGIYGPRRFRSRSGTDESSPVSPSGWRSSYKSAVAGAIAAPPLRRQQPFDRRMRDLVFGEQQVKKQKPRVTRTVQKQTELVSQNVLKVETLQDFKTVVGDESKKLVAVRFYAPYCKACKAVEGHFHSLASQLPGMVFVDVPVSERNASLHQGLGVPSVPFGHIYHPSAGLVEEQSLTRKHWNEFRRNLVSYAEGSCELPAGDFQ